MHDEYLRRCDATWYHPIPFLDSVRKPEAEQRCIEYLKQGLRHRFARVFGYRKNLRGLWLLTRMTLGAPWGWKEPRTTLFAPSWLELFPEARIIHIIRHPLAAAMSIRQRELAFRAAGDPPKPELDDLDYCLRLVLLYIEAGKRLAVRARNYRCIRFEEIQADPSGELRELADFCGLRFSATQLARAAASIRPAILSPWRDIPEESARALSSRYPVLTQLGYEK